MSKEKTKEEVREEFLGHLRMMVSYWEKLEGNHSTKERLEGLAFSMLVAIDGGTNLPSFILAPMPHEDDKEFHTNEGEDYYPENHESDVKCDISGSLHEQFYKK